MNEGDQNVEELFLDHDFYKHRRNKPLFPQDRDREYGKAADVSNQLGIQKKPAPTVYAESRR